MSGSMGGAHPPVHEFLAPLHWCLVSCGWMALGVTGVVLQLLLNIRRLLGKEGVAVLTE